MFRYAPGLAFAVFFFTSTFLLLEAAAQDNDRFCNRIGRIQTGRSVEYREADSVCAGSQITDPVGVEFLCFSSGEIVPINSTMTVDSAFCSRSADIEDTSNPACSRQGIGRLLCLITKGPENEQFQVLQPDLISGPRPDIEWQEVPGAQSYTVRIVDGEDIIWSRQTDATILSYPSEEASLQIGRAYEVIVAANTEGQLTASASKAINISDHSAAVALVNLD